MRTRTRQVAVAVTVGVMLLCASAPRAQDVAISVIVSSEVAAAIDALIDAERTAMRAVGEDVPVDARSVEAQRAEWIAKTLAAVTAHVVERRRVETSTLDIEALKALNAKQCTQVAAIVGRALAACGGGVQQ